MSQRREITLETLQGMFHMPEKQVARELGICLTSLKKIARNVGITRWPFRKLNRLRTLEANMKKMNADTSSLTNLALAYAMNGNAALAPASPAVAALPMQALSVSETIVEQDEDAASSRRPSTVEDEEDETPSCFLSSMDLIVTNWSALWTVKGLRKNLLEPMGGTTLYFSTDGTTATLCFPSREAALRAQRIVNEACSVVGSSTTSQAATRAGSEAGDAEEQEEEEDEASPPAAPAVEPPSLCDIFSNLQPPSRPESMSRPESLSLSRQSSSLHSFLAPCSLSLASPANSRPSSMALVSPATSRPSSMDFRPSSLEFRPSSMEFSDMMHTTLLC